MRQIRLGVVALCVLSSQTIAGTFSDEYFATGPDGPVNCVERWQGGVVIAGSFKHIGKTTAHVIARRVGDTAWEQLGSTLPLDALLDLCVHDGVLYVIGQVTMGGQSVWRLDGDTWTQVGGGVSGHKLASYGGDLYAGPARWTGTTWENVLQTDGWINDFAEIDGRLVLGGSFTSAGGLPIQFVAAWDGHQVSDAFPGQARSVTELEVFHGELYAARNAYMSSLTCLVQTWNGEAWVDQPSLRMNDFTRRVTFMRVEGDRLLVGYRNHEIIIRDYESSLRSWDGQTLTTIYHEWSEHTLHGALPDGDRWLIAGDFVRPGTSPCWNLAYFTGGSLTPVAEIGHGASGDVLTLAADANTLVVGGSFGAISGIWSPGAAFLADGVWSASAMGGLYDLDWQGDRLLALRSDAPYIPSIRYAFCQDGQWHQPWLFMDFGDYATSIAGFQDRVFVASGPTIYEIVSDVFALPHASVPAGQVAVLERVGDILVAAGEFTEIDGVAARNVAFTDGETWFPLGAGLPDEVCCVGVWQSHLVAVSRAVFESATVSMFDGSQWQTIGEITGSHTWFYALQEFDGRLYVGGRFAAVDGIPAMNLAAWDGAQWHGVISTMEPWYSSINALADHDGALWIGGSFAKIDGVIDYNLACYRTGATAAPDSPPAAAALTVTAAPNPFNPRTMLLFSLPTDARVEIAFFDVKGRRVATLLDEVLEAGAHEVPWTAADDGGRALPSGIYLARVRTDGQVATARISLVR